MGIEVTSREVRLVVQLPGIRDPFVNQYEARRKLLEKQPERISWTDTFLVGGADHLKAFFAAELPCQFAPEGSDHGAILFFVEISWGDSIADQYGSPNLWWLRNASNLRNRFHSGELTGRYVSKKVIERQHGVSLAAAKVGL